MNNRFSWNEGDVSVATADEDEKGYNPDQPRVPAGQPGGGQFGSGGGSSSSGDIASMVSFDNENTSSDAVDKIKEYARHMDSSLLEESSVESIQVFDDPADAEEAIQSLVGDRADATGARGVYDRDSGKMITSLWISEDLDQNGRNFYHEFAHTLESRITDPGWEEPWTREWSKFDQDEGFAEAFAEYHVQKREGSTSDFAESYPKTHELFATEWGW